MMYAKSESDDTTSSLATSSPRLSPKPPSRAVYYVQSPSCEDSNEEDKSSSTSATQARNTPVGMRSPSDSVSLFSLFSRQTRLSATSRVSDGAHPGYRRKRRERERIRLLTGGGRHAAADEGESESEREGEVYVNWWRDDEGEELSRSCKFWLGVMVLGLVFSLACFILWGVSKPFHAQVFLKDVAVNNFYFGEGTDLTGVPTKILTINCSVSIRVHNPATFFRIRVSCSTIYLRYYDLTIASGQLEPYYQPRKSWRTMVINIEGTKVPLYGAGPGFVASSDNAEGIPLILDFEIKSLGEVVGKLVKTKHHQYMRCMLNMSSSPHTNRVVNVVENSCT